MEFNASLQDETHYGTRVVRCYADRPGSVHALFANAVKNFPDHIAVVCEAERLTYTELDDAVARMAAGLAAQGVSKGDRVAMLLCNGIPFIVVSYAVARLGAVTVPLSIRDQMPGIRHALTNSGAVAIVLDADLIGLLSAAPETPDLITRVAVGTAPGCIAYKAMLQTAPLRDVTPVEEDAVATILYTSGTTGVPKGAMLTGLGIVHSTGNYLNLMALTSADCTVLVVPMNHVTGLIAGLHALIHAGGRIVIQDTFKAAAFLDCAADEGMTFSLMVPAMYNLCLHQADLSDYDLSRWRIGAYGGAPMPVATIDRLAQALPGLDLMNAYGATETTSPATVMPADQSAGRRKSVGRPVPGAQMRIVNEDGQDRGPGETGEIWIAGAMVVPGYWRNPEADAREFADGYWKSGDIGMIDADGFVHVLDRRKDMVNRGGHKIYTAQVESVLTAFPGVVEAAVVAKPCIILGERVHAVLCVTEGELAEDDLRAYCASQLADYQCPESYSIDTDALPRNANGKIMKRQIREDLGFVTSD